MKAGFVASLERRAPLIAAFGALAGAILTMTADPVGLYFDDGIYALLAKSLAEGNGYVYDSIPGAPAAIHFPPAWPALLALGWKLAPGFPANLAWLKLINPVLIGIAAYEAALVGERIFGLPRLWAAVVALAGCMSIPVLILVNPLLSEPLFIAILFGTLLVSERALREMTPRVVILAACLAALLALTRSIGGVVPIAMVLWLLAFRRWRLAALYAAVVALLLLPWQLFVAAHSPSFPPEIAGSYGPYFAWAVDGYRSEGIALARAVIAENAGSAWRMLGPMLTPTIGGPVRTAGTAILVTFLLTGMIAALFGLAVGARGNARVTALALGGYLVVVMVWPFRVDRFIWAVWPLLMFFAVDGARAVRAAARVAGRPAVVAAVGVALLLAVGNVVYTLRGYFMDYATIASARMAEQALPVIRYVTLNPRLRGRVLATETAPMLALYSGGQVVPVEVFLARDHVRRKSREERAADLTAIDRRFRPGAYILATGGPHEQALPLVTLDSGRTLVRVSAQGSPISSFLVEVRR